MVAGAHCRLRIVGKHRPQACDSQPRNFAIACSVTGVKRFTRLPSGSRRRSERFPHGMVVGAFTKSVTQGVSLSYSASTSSTRNSMMAEWLSAARADPGPNRFTVGVPAMARVNDESDSSANTGFDHV